MGPVELGRALEERGFGSLWAPEHSHIPLSRRTPFPQGGELPKKYYDVMDPFVGRFLFGIGAGWNAEEMDEDGELMARYRDAGVARVVFTLPPAKADEVLPVLDRCAALMRRVSG